MESKLLITVHQAYEAEEIRELLKNNGIPCEFREYGAEGYLRLVGWLNPGGHGIDILVPEKSYEQAKEITRPFTEDYEQEISDEELEAMALAAGEEEDDDV